MSVNLERRVNRRDFLCALGLVGAISTRKSFSNPANQKVVVIGAGAAGLAATDALLDAGIPTVCIEAGNRIGGRVYTDFNHFGVPYDIGAHWIHNGKYSPFKAYGLSEDAINFDVYKPVSKNGMQAYRIFSNDKDITGTKKEQDFWTEYDRVQYSIYSAGKKGLDVSASSVIGKKDTEWFETIHQLIGPFDMAKDFRDVSCVDYANYPYDGFDWFCKQGYGSLLKHRWRFLPVELNTEALTINYSQGDRVVVETSRGTLRAEKCILTVSNGVLASGKIKFIPKFSPTKREAISRINMGLYNHVAVLFRKSFYKEFKITEDDINLYYKINGSNISPRGMGCLLNISGSGLSYFDYGGAFAKELENEGSEAQKHFTVVQLKSIFGSGVTKYISKMHATSWGKDQLSFGSYASADPGYAHLRKVLRLPVSNRIFFAGEATALEYASVSGAHRSGLRAANEVLEALNL